MPRMTPEASQQAEPPAAGGAAAEAPSTRRVAGRRRARAAQPEAAATAPPVATAAAVPLVTAPGPEGAETGAGPGGRSLVARRALGEVVRNAALASYGVTSLAPRTRLGRVRRWLRLGDASVQVALRPDVSADVWLDVAFGLPVAEVARQVDSAVRYELERAVGRAVGTITIHVQGLRGADFASDPAAMHDGDAARSAVTGGGTDSGADPAGPADGGPDDSTVEPGTRAT